MKQLTSLEIACILKELQPLLGSYLRKISQPDYAELNLELYQKEQGKNNIRIIPPYALYLSSVKRQSPPAAYNFCMSLRKRLNNARFFAMEQKNFERIVELHFQKKEEFILIIELFSKGNIILTDKDYKIINSLMKKDWGSRSIKPQETYQYPQKQGENPLTLDYGTFKTIIKNSNKDSIVKTLAADLSLSSLFAEELCARAKLDKNKKQLEEEEMQLLYKKWDELRKLPIAARFFKEEAIPFPMVVSRHQNFVTLPKFNEALDCYYQQFLNKDQLEQEEKEGTKLAMVLEQQEKQIEKFSKEIQSNKEAGDSIYNHYAEIKELLEKIKEMRTKKITMEQIAKELHLEIKDGKVILELKQ